MGSSCSLLAQWKPPSTGTPGRKIQFDPKQEPPAREGREATLTGPERPQGAVGAPHSTPDPLAAPGWLLPSGGFMTSGEEEEGEKGEGG